MTTRAPSETSYFPGEFLTAADYAAEQAYQVRMQRAGTRALSTWGISEGLTAAPSSIAGEIVVSPGLATDGLGRLILLAEPRSITTSTSQGQVLTIAYRETVLLAEPGRVGTILETASLAWMDPSAINDPSLTLTLAVFDGTGLSPVGRVYAGAPAGTVTFSSPLTASQASIIAWSAAPLLGLRIDAGLMSIAAPLPAGQTTAPQSSLSVQAGPLGVGVMSPRASLDVLAPDVDLTGPGLLTSYDAVVRGSDPRFGQIVHVGDTLVVIDREGQHRRSQVTAITSNTEVTTATPLNCADAPFTYVQALVASVRNSQNFPALSVDRAANVGLGSAAPAARLEIGDGDVELSVNGAVLGFSGQGLVQAAAGASRISFRPTPPSGSPEQLVFAQTGEIQWLPGRVGAPATPPVGMVLDPQGNLGIGLQNPVNKLDIDGVLQLTSGGLVFPDGSVQTTAQVSAPIGSIIDWWQGSASQHPPENFMICAGGVVNEPKSPLHGQAIPNLDNLFVVGVASTGSTLALSGSDSHQHPYATPAHTHPYPHTHDAPSGITGQANGSDGTGTSSDNAASEHYHDWKSSVGQASSAQTGNNSDATDVVDTQPASTIPPYVGLLKLIRIL